MTEATRPGIHFFFFFFAEASSGYPLHTAVHQKKPAVVKALFLP